MRFSTHLRFGHGTGILLSLLFTLVCVWFLFHKLIDRSLAVHLFLSSNSPREELFDQVVRGSADPVSFLQQCWSTGKIVHRQMVVAYLKNEAVSPPAWIAKCEPLLLASVSDADASVRELGLAALDQLRSSHLFEAARVQLDDLDPLIRRLGIDYLRKSTPIRAIPLLVRELDDPDLKNVTATENALMRFSGVDFGVRASQAIEDQDGSGAELTNSNKLAAIEHGVEQRKNWWLEHQKEYAANDSSAAPASQPSFAENPRPTAADFTLPSLAGKSVRLSDFKGKVVLVNFWATWCTACLKEIPDLKALQQRMGDKVMILGIALDGVPDQDGDEPADETKKDQGETALHGNVRAKVERAVKLRGINYPILLDPKGKVGGQYNGGELPTTVIFDAEGRVRRRFIGERSLALFRAMVDEAAHPVAAGKSQRSAQE